MTTNNRTAKKYNQLVGRIDNSYYFLDEIFKYSDDFHGATATVIEPISKDEYKEATSVENVRNYLYEIWQMQVADGGTEQGLDDFVEYCLRYENEADIVYVDLVDDERTEDLRKRFALSLDDYPAFQITGGGRSFSKHMDWDEVYNQDLLTEIEKVEEN